MTLPRERGAQERMARRVAPAKGTYTRGSGLDVRNGGFRPRGEGGGGSSRGPLILLGLLGVVILLLIFVLPSLLGGVFRNLAEGNADWLRLPFVADAVREEVADRLDVPAGTDPTPVEFVIEPDTSARDITDDLVRRGLVTDRLAFSYILVTEGSGSRLQAGTHTLNRTMSPRQVADELQRSTGPSGDTITLALRNGLRIEQVTAYLMTVEQLAFDPAEFFTLATNPPAELVAEFSMLASLPAGRSLEGYLSFGVIEVERDTDATGFLRTLLARREAELGGLLTEPPPAGLSSFYEVLTVASIVEAETDLDEERALVAGVYLNRLDRAKWPTRLLNADPTVIYGNDTLALEQLDMAAWVDYVFWAPRGQPMAQIFLRDELAGYQTYHSRGLPPGPIRSPSLPSIQAVFAAETDSGYLYFVAKNDDTRGHAFARTFEEHLANIRRYQGGEPQPSTTP